MEYRNYDYLSTGKKGFLRENEIVTFYLYTNGKYAFQIFPQKVVLSFKRCSGQMVFGQIALTYAIRWLMPSKWSQQMW